MEMFLIALLIGASFQSGTSAKAAKDVKYTGPVVYSNLPPPVLYFPNFPEKPQISRGDEDDKRVEYVPFPYKDLPLLVYQSENQPPVHVVEKPTSQDDQQESPAPASVDTNSKSLYPMGPAVYQLTDYTQPNRPQQQYSQAQSQEGSNDQYPADVYPDLQNQQYIGIGLSTYHEDGPVTLYSAPASTPTSQSQQKQYESQNVMQQSPKQQPQMQYTASAAQSQGQQQYVAAQNGGQVYAQAQGMPNPVPQQMVSQKQNGGEQYYQAKQKVVVQVPLPVVTTNLGQQILAIGQQYGKAQQQQYGNGQQQQYGNAQQQQYGNTQQQQYGNVQQQQYGNAQQQQYLSAQQQQPQQMVANMKQQQPVMVANNGYQVQAQPQAIYAIQENNPQRIPQQQAYQPASTNNNVNSQQYLAVMQSNSKAQTQMPPKQLPLRMPQQEQGKQQLQSEGGLDLSGQHVSIGVYAYDGANKEPQQVYTFVIPPNVQQPDIVEQERPVYKELRNPNPMQSKQQQIPQGYRNGNGSLSNVQIASQQTNIYAAQQQQKKAPVENQMKIQGQNRNRYPSPPAQSSGEKEQEDPIEYQHILIHIPHNVSPQPQISVHHNSGDSSAVRYPGATDGAGFSDGSNKLLNSAMSNLRNAPQRERDNNGYRKAQKKPPSEFGNEYDSLKSPPMPKFPSYSGLESKLYPQSMIRNPFEDDSKSGPSFEGNSKRGNFRGHPGAYSSSNLQYSSANPFQQYRGNFNRKPQRYSHASASISRPSYMPIRQRFPSPFPSGFSEEYVAEPSFHSHSVSSLAPSILESSNITDFKFLDDAESEVFYTGQDSVESHGYRGQNLVDDSAVKLYQKLNQDGFSGEISGFGKVKTGHTAMELMGFPQPPLSLPVSIPQSVPLPQTIPLPPPVHLPPLAHLPPPMRPLPMTPYVPYQYQALQGPRYHPMQPPYKGPPKKNRKYGGFIRKLASLSSTIFNPKLGIKAPGLNREESKDAEIHPRDGGFGNAEVIQNVPLSSTIIQTDTSGLDGIPIPLNLNRRVSQRTPPIIVYKGKEPPVEVYGTKADIEKMRPEEDPMEASASETHEVGHKGYDEDSEETGLDYIDMMYSLLPDFLKDSITPKKDGVSNGWSPVDSAESVAESPQNVTSSEDGVEETNSTSGALDTDVWSAFKEDLKELVKLWPKEEKSDLLSP